MRTRLFCDLLMLKHEIFTTDIFIQMYNYFGGYLCFPQVLKKLLNCTFFPHISSWEKHTFTVSFRPFIYIMTLYSITSVYLLY